VLFSYELNRKYFKQLNIHAYAADPGLVNTSTVEKRTGGLIKCFWGIRKKHGISPEKAAGNARKPSAIKTITEIREAV